MWSKTAATAIAAAFVAVATAGAPASSPRAPAIQTMIVGRSAVLLRATAVRAGATRLRVGVRTCAIPAATPIAALAAARSAGGPSFAVRDYGHCSTSARDAASLYVSQIGGDLASGRNGWVYKVDGRVGTTGAADPSGPFGDGHALRAGQRLLWFWCNAGSNQHCQRSLAIRLHSNAVTRGARVRITVVGDDDNGRATAVSGATVTVAGHATRTSGSGAATVTAPAAAGRYSVSATAPGLVPSFPVSLIVK